MRKSEHFRPLFAVCVTSTMILLVLGCDDEPPTALRTLSESRTPAGPQNPSLLAQGKTIFRFDTFGDETFWTDTLRMHEVIRGTIGQGVSPMKALSVGLKVDFDTLPPQIKAALAANTINLNDPATTVTLIRLGAVVGLVGQVDANNVLTRVGVTCALCHSTVDDSFGPGIGSRLDGWPNRTLDPGAIIALSPTPTAAQKTVYTSWGPGMYDPRFNIDGQNVPVVIPPAFGLRHVKRELYTGDDVVSYWNAYVAITQMHGHGTFVDPRIGVSKSNPPDLVSSKLEPLRAYQFSLSTPNAAGNSFDANAAKRGKQVFNGEAKCIRCHIGSTYTDVNAGKLHTPTEVGQNPTYALRSVTKVYRTTPLRGLWNPPQLQGPYFHDGSATNLQAVVEHYVTTLQLSLSAQQKSDLVEYLKTL